MKILVVDDHALIRQAMQGVLKKLKRDVVLLEASNGTRAVEIVTAHPDIDLVLLDLSLPDRDGFLVLDELRQRNPASAIVVLSAVQDAGNVRKAFERGARGYIPKSAPSDVILNALRLINAGGTYVPPEIMVRDDKRTSASPEDSGKSSPLPPAIADLSNRQREVVALLMQGKNNKSICRLLNLSEATVKTHVTAVLRALGVKSRTEAVVKMNSLGLRFPVAPE